MSDVRDTNHDGKVSLVEKVKDKILPHKDTAVLPTTGAALDSRDLNRDGHVSAIEKIANTHINDGPAFHTNAVPASGVVPAVAIVPAVVSSSYATGAALDSRDSNRDGHVSLTEKLAATHIGTKETDEQMRLKLHEEQLAISKREVGAGEVDIRKRVHEQHVSQTVPVMREEVIVERRPLSGIADPNARIAAQDETLHVAMFREEVITEKRVVPIEEVIVRKKEVVDQQVVGATLRSEHIETVQTNALQSFSSTVLTAGAGVHDARDTNLDGHVSMGEKIKGAALGTNNAVAPKAARG